MSAVINNKNLLLTSYLNTSNNYVVDSQQQQILAKLIGDIAVACKIIAYLTAKGSLAGVSDKLETENVQGETQVNLDVLSNGIFLSALKNSGTVAGIVSEEIDHPIIFDQLSTSHQCLVLFDPLDGSSNVAVNGAVGTIFSILAVPNTELKEDSFLQPGKSQLAAGYCIYGPSTMLILSLGNGTHGFTLNTDTGEFHLTHPSITIPNIAKEYAINASNERFWEQPIQRYISECKDGISGNRGHDFNMRWAASMVADMHRILIRGGVYLYPKDNKLPPKDGRLRLMYEANPIGMLVEQAGGKCSTGRGNILEVIPTNIHQRIPVILGPVEEVRLIEKYHHEFDIGDNSTELNSPLFANRSIFKS